MKKPSDIEMLQMLKERRSLYIIDADNYHDYMDDVVFYYVIESEIWSIDIDENNELLFGFENDDMVDSWDDIFLTEEEALERVKELSVEVINGIGCNVTREELNRQEEWLSKHGSYDDYKREVA
jgi:hypothetical protein